MSAVLHGTASGELSRTVVEARTLAAMTQEVDVLRGAMDELTDVFDAKESELLMKAEELVKSRA
jgi:hypothetical protein